MSENMKLVKVSDFPSNRENPFLPKAIPEIRTHFKKAFVNSAGADRKAIFNAVDPDTGEVVGNTTFVKKKVVDDDQFTKIFLSQFQTFFDLSTVGLRVFGYIMTCMKVSCDMIYFDKEACKEYTKYKSSASIYKGIAELLSCGIIARGWSDGIFFLNPLVVWNGDRVTFVTQYEKQSKTRKEDKNQLAMHFEEFEDVDAEVLDSQQ